MTFLFFPFSSTMCHPHTCTLCMQCVSSCPPQYYRDVLTSASGPIVVGTGVCRPCSRGCTSCSGPLPSQCSQCAGVGLRHANGSLECMNACPKGTYMDPSTMMCQACDTVCECCARPLTDYCSACMDLRSESCVSGCMTTSSMNGSGNGECWQQLMVSLNNSPLAYPEYLVSTYIAYNVTWLLLRLQKLEVALPLPLHCKLLDTVVPGACTYCVYGGEPAVCHCVKG